MMRSIQAAALCVLAVSPCVARAQAPDSTPRFSLFGGTALGNAAGANAVLKVEGGISADFRTRAFPLPLRTTLAFGRDDPTHFSSTRRYGTLGVDAIARPVKGLFGFHPYLLGGLGVATSAEYTSYALTYAQVNDPNRVAIPASSIIRHSRENWVYAEGGAGLEFGHFYLQAKLQSPVASNGPTRMPISLGFHF